MLVAPMLLLAAAPSVAVSELSAVGVSKELAAFTAEQTVHALSTEGLKVFSQSDIAALFGLERQKQLLGCADDGIECRAEMTQALGVDLLVLGSLARLGNTLQLTLRMLDAHTGALKSRWSGATTSESELPALAEKAALALTSVAVKRPSQAPFWVTLAASVALLAGSGFCFGLQADAHASLTAPPYLGTLDDPTAAALVQRGKIAQLAWPILAGASAAALVTAVVLRIVRPDAPTVSLEVGTTGAGVTFGGQL